MTDYPTITNPIHHNPRPSTCVLEAADKTDGMSSSPTLLAQSGLEPAPSTHPIDDSSTTDDDNAECPQFILFGDSITQFSTLTLQAYLQTQYIRRLDVINRGFSGYNAPMGFRTLQKFLPSNTPPSTWPRIKLMTVFFGANDACVPGEQQHVELQEYIDTIKNLVSYPVLQKQKGAKTQVVLITPPPVNEHQFERMPSGHFQRRAGITSQYARAAVRAGKAYGVPVLDFWTVIMRKVDWMETMGRDCCCKHISCHFDASHQSGAKAQHIPGCCHMPARLPQAKYQLSDFLTDGLHLTKLGYDTLFWSLMKLIRCDIPDYAPEKLPFAFPEWRDALVTREYCAG